MQLHSELEQTDVSGRAVRRHVRHLYSVPVQLRRISADREQSSHGITLDVSEGGFAAMVEAKLNAGETVIAHFLFPSACLDARAAVRYAGSSRSGFEFLDLPQEARRQIAAAGELLDG